jgi:hypothetical protein
MHDLNLVIISVLLLARLALKSMRTGLSYLASIFLNILLSFLYIQPIPKQVLITLSLHLSLPLIVAEGQNITVCLRTDTFEKIEVPEWLRRGLTSYTERFQEG